MTVQAFAASAIRREPLVTLSRIGKTYSNGTEALRDVDLTIGRAEFVSLLGPSGCGKSTILRLIAGLGDLSSGRIEWAGGAVDTKRDIGFVFQEPTLMPWATVADNVWLPLKLAASDGAPPATGSPRRWRWSISRGSRTPIRASCPAA